MSDQKLSYLQRETGCDPIFGKLILKFTGGDIDGAIKIIKSVDKDIVVVRGKFVAQVERVFGTFIFFYDWKNKSIDKMNVTIRKEDKSAIEFDFEEDLNSFMKGLSEYSHRNVTEVEMQNRFLNTLRSIRAIQFFDSKLVPRKEIDEKSLNIFLKDILLNITGDLNVVVKLKIEKYDAFEINKGINNEEDFEIDKNVEKEVKSERKKESFDSQVIVLKVDFELAPVEGIRLSELSIGDSVGVRIIDERPIASYISSLLADKDELKNDNRLYIAELKDIKLMEETGFTLTVEFGPGIYGKAYYGEDVKVRRVTKDEDEDDKTEVKENFILKNWWIFAGIFVCIVIMVILFITRY